MKGIVIQKADKGNTVVITDKTKYTVGIESLLSDGLKFEKMKTRTEKMLNSVISLEKSFRLVLNGLHEKEKISSQDNVLIHPTGSRPGITYGLPKVHRPVVNNQPKLQNQTYSICY